MAKEDAITVQQAQQKRRQLEIDIHDLLMDFSRNTHIAVEDVKVYTRRTIGSTEFYYQVKVEVEL